MKRLFVVICLFGLIVVQRGYAQEVNEQSTAQLLSFGHDPDCPGCRAFLAGYSSPSCSCESAAGNGAGGGGEYGGGGFGGGDGQFDAFGDDMLAADFGSGFGYESAMPNMIGDSLIGGGMLTHQDASPGEAVAAGLFSFHTFKVAEDDSPWPKNRIYFDINDYHNVPGTDTLTRYMFGFERTFWDGQASLGMRLPLWNADIENVPTPPSTGVPFGAPGSNTAFGDLTITVKAKLREGDLGVLTGGLSGTLPTGPDTLANVDPYYSMNGVSHLGAVQPWLGFYRARVSYDYGLFTQAFLAFDLPVDQDDADYLFLDLGTGYRIPRDGIITAITPMFEAHWSTPIADDAQTLSLTPLGATVLDFASQQALTTGVLGYRNQVNLTAALNFEIRRTSTIVVGVAIPTVGPHVMDAEFICQCNGFMW